MKAACAAKSRQQVFLSVSLSVSVSLSILFKIILDFVFIFEFSFCLHDELFNGGGGPQVLAGLDPWGWNKICTVGQSICLV